MERNIPRKATNSFDFVELVNVSEVGMACRSCKLHRRKEGRSLSSHRTIGVLACTDESWPTPLPRFAEGAITQAIYTHADDSRPVRSVKSSVVSDLQNSVDQLTIYSTSSYPPTHPPARHAVYTNSQ